MHYRLDENSQMRAVLDAPDGAQDVTDPLSPGVMVRPRKIMLTAYPALDGSRWELSTAVAIGPKIMSGDRLTQRDYDVAFTRPQDEDTDGVPDWLRAFAVAYLEHVNAVPQGTAPRALRGAAGYLRQIERGMSRITSQDFRKGVLKAATTLEELARTGLSGQEPKPEGVAVDIEDVDRLVARAQTLPPETKLWLLEAMGFTPIGSAHQPDCMRLYDRGIRCDCVPPATVWGQPSDVAAHRKETWEDRVELARAWSREGSHGREKED